jgi:hypothetical protein
VPRLKIEESLLQVIEIPRVASAYIMANRPLEDILLDRTLVGLKFATACQLATEAFLKHFADEISECGSEIAELVLLSKGLSYWMHHAFANVFHRNLESNFIVTKRTNVSGCSVNVEVPYRDFSVPAANLIIADTIASGSTIRAALEQYLAFQRLRKVYIFSIAGSVVGAQIVSEFCRAHDIDVTIIFGLAAFGLSANGFDLSFLHPDTICPNPEYIEIARRMFDGKPVSAVGWDFGSQAQAVQKYKMLCWIEAEYWDLQESNVFRIKQPVVDMRLVKKEAGAYSDRVRLLVPQNPTTD